MIWTQIWRKETYEKANHLFNHCLARDNRRFKWRDTGQGRDGRKRKSCMAGFQGQERSGVQRSRRRDVQGEGGRHLRRQRYVRYLQCRNRVETGEWEMDGHFPHEHKAGSRPIATWWLTASPNVLTVA